LWSKQLSSLKSFFDPGTFDRPKIPEKGSVCERDAKTWNM